MCVCVCGGGEAVLVTLLGGGNSNICYFHTYLN